MAIYPDLVFSKINCLDTYSLVPTRLSVVCVDLAHLDPVGGCGEGS